MADNNIAQAIEIAAIINVQDFQLKAKLFLSQKGTHVNAVPILNRLKELGTDEALSIASDWMVDNAKNPYTKLFVLEFIEPYPHHFINAAISWLNANWSSEKIKDFVRQLLIIEPSEQLIREIWEASKLQSPSKSQEILPFLMEAASEFPSLEAELQDVGK